MARQSRVVIPDCAHHVTQRGNNGREVFHSDTDRAIYLKTIRRFCERHEVAVVGYCLMNNHVHLVLIPPRENSLAKAIGQAHCDYTRWYNVAWQRGGHLWQNRFFSCPMDEGHMAAALRYVECNPVRAGLQKAAWDWPWSSARAHISGRDDTGLLAMDFWRQRRDERRWQTVLDRGFGVAEIEERIREATRTGRSFGPDSFVTELEAKTGRRLRPGKPGPKPRVKAVSAVWAA